MCYQGQEVATEVQPQLVEENNLTRNGKEVKPGWRVDPGDWESWVPEGWEQWIRPTARDIRKNPIAFGKAFICPKGGRKCYGEDAVGEHIRNAKLRGRCCMAPPQTSPGLNPDPNQDEDGSDTDPMDDIEMSDRGEGPEDAAGGELPLAPNTSAQDLVQENAPACITNIAHNGAVHQAEQQQLVEGAAATAVAPSQHDEAGVGEDIVIVVDLTVDDEREDYMEMMEDPQADQLNVGAITNGNTHADQTHNGHQIQGSSQDFHPQGNQVTGPAAAAAAAAAAVSNLAPAAPAPALVGPMGGLASTAGVSQISARAMNAAGGLLDVQQGLDQRTMRTRQREDHRLEQALATGIATNSGLQVLGGKAAYVADMSLTTDLTAQMQEMEVTSSHERALGNASGANVVSMPNTDTAGQNYHLLHQQEQQQEQEQEPHGQESLRGDLPLDSSLLGTQAAGSRPFGDSGAGTSNRGKRKSVDNELGGDNSAKRASDVERENTRLKMENTKLKAAEKKWHEEMARRAQAAEQHASDLAAAQIQAQEFKEAHDILQGQLEGLQNDVVNLGSQLQAANAAKDAAEAEAKRVTDDMAAQQRDFEVTTEQLNPAINQAVAQAIADVMAGRWNALDQAESSA